MKALRILADEHGMAVAPRRITLFNRGRAPPRSNGSRPSRSCEPGHSRCTRRPRISATCSSRSTGSTGLKDLLPTRAAVPLKRRERITFEYVLLKEVNDTPADRGAW